MRDVIRDGRLNPRFGPWLPLVLLAAVMLAGCGGRGVYVDRPDAATFDGRTYLGVVPTATRIEAGATTRIGDAMDVYGRVRSTTVYRLAGVDPSAAIALRTDDGTFMVFVAESEPRRTPTLAQIPGMCAYAVREPGC